MCWRTRARPEPQGVQPLVAAARQHGGGAVGESDAAETAEKGLALKIEGAGRGRRRRRRDHAAQADPVTRVQGGLPPAQAQAHLFRRAVRVQSADARALQGDPDAPGEGLDADDASGDAGRAEAFLQHRRRHRGRPPLDDGEAAADHAQPEGHDQQHRPPPPGHTEDRGRGHARRTQPQRRLHRQGEVQRDAKAQADRQPQRPTLPFPGQRRFQAPHRGRKGGLRGHARPRRYSGRRWCHGGAKPVREGVRAPRLLRPAAYFQKRAGDEGRFVGQQPDDRRAHVVGQAGTAEGDRRSDPVDARLAAEGLV